MAVSAAVGGGGGDGACWGGAVMVVVARSVAPGAPTFLCNLPRNLGIGHAAPGDWSATADMDVTATDCRPTGFP